MNQDFPFAFSCSCLSHSLRLRKDEDTLKTETSWHLVEAFALSPLGISSIANLLQPFTSRNSLTELRRLLSDESIHTWHLLRFLCLR